jgi:subtilisin family serine protease
MGSRAGPIKRNIRERNMQRTNRQRTRVTSLLLLLFAAAMPVVAFSAPAQPAANTYFNYLPAVQVNGQPREDIRDEVIVKLQPNATIGAVNQTYGTTTIRPLAPTRAIYLLQVAPGTDPEQLAGQMGNDARILYAEPNRATDSPEAIGRMGFAWGGQDNGPYSEQYARQMLNLDAAHAVSRGAGITVAVIDTGVQLNHPDLAGHLTAARIDFVDGDTVPEDEFAGGTTYGAGHGTHVAGIIHLVAPQARIMPIRVLDTDGRGYAFTVAEAILFALENGANVINLSLGMPQESDLLEDIIEEAAEAGVVVVAAAGNLNSNQKQYPAASECVLGVTAIDANRIKAAFANYGNWVLLSAPGVGIYSTLPANGYGSWSGTSMAAPFVAGGAALLLSRDSGLNVVQVADLMGGTAVNLNPFNPAYINQLGAGQIDLAAGLNALLAGNIPDLELIDDDCADDDDDDDDD